MIEIRTKSCTGCKEVKPVGEFHVSATKPNGRVVYQPRCKVCYNAHYISKWHKKDDLDKRKELFKRKEKYNSDWFKSYRLATKYNLTVEQFQQMQADQDGKCAICITPITGSAVRVDHCHKTGKTRDLLCHNCNTLLGHAKDDVNILKNAIEYLKKHDIL